MEPTLQNLWWRKEEEEQLGIEGEVFQSTKQGRLQGRSDSLYVVLLLKIELIDEINVKRLHGLNVHEQKSGEALNLLVYLIGHHIVIYVTMELKTLPIWKTFDLTWSCMGND